MSELRELRKADRRAARRIARRRKPPPIGYRAPPPAEQMRARFRFRHWLVLLSFLALFVAPSAAVSWYLNARAADQFVSRAALTVTSDDFLASSGMMDDLLNPAKDEASDTDILVDYILSQDMVTRVDAALDLRTLYRRAAARDPLLSLGSDPSIEALVAFWRFMVDVAYEPRQGIVNLRVRAFDPRDAQAINLAIVAESQRLVNALTDTARADAVRYAEADLAEMRAGLEALWDRLRAFRNENRVILPDAEAATRFAVLGSLQDLMATALVERASLIETTRAADPRLAQLDRRIAAITRQIAEERARLGSETAGDRPISQVLGEYETILVDIEFAQGAYLAALGQLDAARTEARRLSRYLSVHVRPTLPQSAEYPQRLLLGVLTPLLFLCGWLIVVFVAYNIRDSR